MGEIQKRADTPPVFRPEPVPRPTVWTNRTVDQSTGRVIEVHHHYHAPDPAPQRRPTVADKFTPYFVIMAYLVVITGCLGIVGAMVIPPFMAAMIALSASLITLAASAVGILIVLAVIAWIVRGMINDQRDHDHND
jgi:hypothetical protein